MIRIDSDKKEGILEGTKKELLTEFSLIASHLIETDGIDEDMLRFAFEIVIRNDEEEQAKYVTEHLLERLNEALDKLTKKLKENKEKED